MGKAIDIIKKSMKKNKMTQTKLADSLGEDVRVINQQLNRQQDIKADRFLEVMEHLGYQVVITENNGIRKISQEMKENVIATAMEGDKFYIQEKNGSYTGIKIDKGEVMIEAFWNKPDCFKWLISHA